MTWKLQPKSYLLEKGKWRVKAGSGEKLGLNCPHGLVQSALLLLCPILCASKASQQADALPGITVSEW